MSEVIVPRAVLERAHEALENRILTVSRDLDSSLFAIGSLMRKLLEQGLQNDREAASKIKHLLENERPVPTFHCVGGSLDGMEHDALTILKIGDYRLFGFAKDGQHFIEVAFHGASYRHSDVFAWFNTSEGEAFYASKA